jgi:hypothetical protein
LPDYCEPIRWALLFVGKPQWKTLTRTFILWPISCLTSIPGLEWGLFAWAQLEHQCLSHCSTSNSSTFLSTPNRHIQKGSPCTCPAQSLAEDSLTEFSGWWSSVSVIECLKMFGFIIVLWQENSSNVNYSVMSGRESKTTILLIKMCSWIISEHLDFWKEKMCIFVNFLSQIFLIYLAIQGVKGRWWTMDNWEFWGGGQKCGPPSWWLPPS